MQNRKIRTIAWFPPKQRLSHRLRHKKLVGGEPKKEVKDWRQGDRAGGKVAAGEVTESLLWVMGAQFYWEL